MSELHTATALITAEVIDTLEIPARRTGTAGLRKLTLAQVKAYIAATGVLTLQGGTDLSANPNYPAAIKGDTYYATVAGKIGGASGKALDIGDAYIASADNAGGTEAGVGANWFALEHNLVSALTGSVASTTDVLTGTSTTKLASPGAIAALWEKSADVASASTVTFGDGGYFFVTGTTTITALALSTDLAGREIRVKFAGVLTLTNNATSLILPTGANITTAAGDVAVFISEGSGNFRCVAYNRASGVALASTAITTNEQTVTSASTVTPTFSNDIVTITAQAAALTLANPTGTADDGHGLVIRIKDDGTARAITFDTQFRAMGVTLPTTTVISKWLYVSAIYNSTDTKWDVVGVLNQA